MAITPSASVPGRLVADGWSAAGGPQPPVIMSPRWRSIPSSASNSSRRLQVDEQAWLDSIREMSSTDLAKRLGITDRQARRIKTGKVGEARLREHAKTDRDQQKEGCRLRPRRAWAAFLLLRRAVNQACDVSRIAA